MEMHRTVTTQRLINAVEDRMRQIVKVYKSGENSAPENLHTAFDDFLNIDSTVVARAVANKSTDMAAFIVLHSLAHDKFPPPNKDMDLDTLVEMISEFMVQVASVSGMDWFYKGYFAREIQEQNRMSGASNG